MNSLELAGELSPLAGAAVLGAAALAGAAGGALLAARARGGSARAAVGLLYTLAAAALAAALVAPTAVATRNDPVLPRVLILVDRSASMREPDCSGGRARWEAAAAVAENARLRCEQERSARVPLLAFDRRLRPLRQEDLAGPAAGPATDISGAVAAALETPGVGPLAAVVVVSDGRSTAGLPVEVAAPTLAAGKVPVWTVGVGEAAAAARPRLRLTGLEVPETATLGQEVAAEATVEAANLSGRKVEVCLLLDGQALDRRELPASAAAERLPVRFTFPARPEGARRVELLAVAAPGVSARALRHLVVLSAPLRILYAEGRLGWGYRELSGALAAAPGRELSLWNGFLPPESRPGAADADLAARAGTLDLVVLGDVSAADLGAKGAAALARAVREDGCGVLLMAAPERALTFRGTPLEALLPVELNFEPLPTAPPLTGRKIELVGDAGRAEALRLDPAPAADYRLWSSLPETRPGWKLGRLRPGAEAWLRAGGEPVLAVWKAGAGRAAVMSWPDHWRWSRSSPEGAEAYRRFFVRLSAWLAGRETAGGEKLALALGSYRLAPGEEVSLVARLLQEPPEALPEVSARVRDELAAKGGDRGETLGLAPVSRGLYRATVRADSVGEYRIEVAVRAGGSEWAKAEVFFSVEGRELETENPAPDFAALAALAKATGGRFLPAAEAGGLPELLRKSLPQPVPRVRRAQTLLWDRLWLLWLGLASLCGAWTILRRGR